jgi:hypothetical protein
MGVATFLKRNNALFSARTQYQLRGMAKLKESQGHGFGKIILGLSELILKKKKADLIWCNAREVAVNFYKKMAVKLHKNYLKIRDIGTHCMMYKNI